MFVSVSVLLLLFVEIFVTVTYLFGIRCPVPLSSRRCVVQELDHYNYGYDLDESDESMGPLDIGALR